MRVENVRMIKFRGVSETKLSNCGSLNVLIGKNNSGKSTLLDAIDAFFSVMASGALVMEDAPLAARMNFHKGDSSESSQILITVDLQLEADEMAGLLSDVLKDAPQMKNALDGVDESQRLRITVVSAAAQYAYVSEICLVVPESPLASGRNRRLLAISQAAASELLNRQRMVAESERKVYELVNTTSRIDQDTFQMFKTRESGGGTSSRRWRMFESLDLDDLLLRSENYTDFRREIDLLTSSMGQSVEARKQQPLSESIETFSGESHEAPRYAIAILNLVGKTNVLHLRDRREPVGREEAKRLLALKVKRGGSDVLKFIQETVQSLLGVNIDAFESENTAATGNESRAEMDVDEVLVEMNGAGIREALRLILDNELGTPQLLLVEEPEVHLHPALELSMLRYLKSASSRCQIFLTTHSTNFLDTTEMRNVYLVRKDPWVTADLIDYEQAETAIPVELGIRLSSLFMHDRLVFVEGPSDEAILRELASTAGVNFGQNNVGFVVMGSSRNFAHYASQATIDFLTKRQVKMFFVLDRDEASEEEVASLVDRLGEKAKLHVLKRRELENYLAIPTALARFVDEKRSLGELPALALSLDEINAAIRECVESLKILAVEKRVTHLLGRPIYLDKARLTDNANDPYVERLAREVEKQRSELMERAAKAEACFQRELKNVEKLWENSRMEIVPGDELLDCICKKFDVRYKKERDAARLARLVAKENISTELTDLLGRLVT